MSQITRDYDIINQIGAGTFSAVYKAKRKSDGLIVAIKMIEVQSREEISLIYNEVEVLKHLMGGHPSIPETYDFFSEGPVFFLIMEYLDDFITLLEWTNTYAPILFYGTQNGDDIQGLVKTREEYISIILKKILSSLNFLHSKRVVHRDLKLENIMINPKNFSIKLIDFGFSVISESMVWTTICGSFEYMAPEILRDLIRNSNSKEEDSTMPYSLQSEVWPLGVILYGLIFCRLPFVHQNRIKLINLVLNSEPSFYPENAICDPNLRNLVLEMLQKDPSNRISFSQISRHPFLNDTNKIGTNNRFKKSTSFDTQINKLTYIKNSSTSNKGTDNSKTDTEIKANKSNDNFSQEITKPKVEPKVVSKVVTKNDAKADTKIQSKCLPLSYRVGFTQFHKTGPKYSKSLRIGARIIAPKIITHT